MTKNALDTYKKLAKKIFKKELGNFVTQVDLREDVDFSEDEALFFDVHLDQTAPFDLGKDFLFAHLSLRQQLEELNEHRFPYVDTRRPYPSDMPTDTILKSRKGSGSQSVRRSAR